jgi:hypothetical protein
MPTPPATAVDANRRRRCPRRQHNLDADGCPDQGVRRAEDHAVLGARVVVELHTESHAATPSIRAWAIARRADRGHRLAGQRASRAERRKADRTSRTDRPHQPHRPPEREMVADAADPYPP